MTSFFSDTPIIKIESHTLKEEVWENYLTKEKKSIYRFFNGYEKGLVKKEKNDTYWANINNNWKVAESHLSAKGGFSYHNFHILPEDRSIELDFDYPVSLEPISFQTVFVSGFLFPQSNIKKINSGFYIHRGNSQDLNTVVQKHFDSSDFPAVLFNFGYYYTKGLLKDKEFGHTKLREELNLNDELLQEDWLPYLGPSFSNTSAFGFVYHRRDVFRV